ncbi:MAG: hypothetical protein PHN80_12220, partial [Hespellia sp.]|nr:hypothetical protein [Hespellia sp.]
MSNISKRSLVSLLFVSFAYNAIYSLILSKSLYYTTLQYGFHISNLQVGQLFGACGVLCMIAYLCGS